MGAVEDLGMREQYMEDRKNFLNGGDKDKEEFVRKYGVDEGVDVLSREINATKVLRGKGTGGSQYHDELLQWRERLIERQGGKGVPTSQAASDLGFA